MRAVVPVLLGLQGDAYTESALEFLQLSLLPDFIATSCLQRGVSFRDGNTTHRVWKASRFYHESR